METQSKSYSKKKKKEDLAALDNDHKAALTKLKKQTLEMKKQIDVEASALKAKITRDYQITKNAILRAKHEFDIKKDQSEAFIKKHPFISVGGATLGGMLLHKIFRKRK